MPSGCRVGQRSAAAGHLIVPNTLTVAVAGVPGEEGKGK